MKLTFDEFECDHTCPHTTVTEHIEAHILEVEGGFKLELRYDPWERLEEARPLYRLNHLFLTRKKAERLMEDVIRAGVIDTLYWSSVDPYEGQPTLF